MLVLQRRINEGITINNNIEIVVLGMSAGRVKIGIQAPTDAKILRNELIRKGKEGDRGRKS